MTYKSSTTKQALAEIKEKHKKENDMKTINYKSKLKTVVTVVITLAVVAAGYWLYMQGYNAGKYDQKQIAYEAEQMSKIQQNH